MSEYDTRQKDDGPQSSDLSQSIRRSDRILRILKSLAYLFCGIAVLNVFLQTINYIVNFPASVELVNVIVIGLGPVVSAFFFLGFIVFVEIVRAAPDEDE